MAFDQPKQTGHRLCVCRRKRCTCPAPQARMPHHQQAGRHLCDRTGTPADDGTGSRRKGEKNRGTRTVTPCHGHHSHHSQCHGSTASLSLGIVQCRHPLHRQGGGSGTDGHWVRSDPSHLLASRCRHLSCVCPLGHAEHRHLGEQPARGKRLQGTA